MPSIHQWLREYGDSHVHPVNERLHWVCVPLIMLSIIGLLWAIPVPAWPGDRFPLLNWSTLFVLAALLYYLVLSRPLAMGMVPVCALMIAGVRWLDGFHGALWAIYVAVFGAAWIGQFIGHAVEGKRPSFLQDAQFLLIGPLWLLAAVYRRLGIRY